MTSSLPEPQVWRNGVLVREKDLDASGNPPPAEEPQMTDEWPVTPPDLSMYTLTIRDHLGTATDQLVAAAVRRSHMTKDERSGLDMIQEARTLSLDARRIEAVWRAEQERLAEEKRLDAEALDLYRKWER